MYLNRSPPPAPRGHFVEAATNGARRVDEADHLQEDEQAVAGQRRVHPAAVEVVQMGYGDDERGHDDSRDKNDLQNIGKTLARCCNTCFSLATHFWQPESVVDAGPNPLARRHPDGQETHAHKEEGE